MKKLDKRIYASRNGATMVLLASGKSDDAIKIPNCFDMGCEFSLIPIKASNTPILDGIEAAKGQNSDSETREEFTLLANTGVPMMLANFYFPLVIDMAGVKFSRKTSPIIADHDTSLRIGHTLSQAVLKAGVKRKIDGIDLEGPLIYARGVRSSDMAIAQGIVGDAKNGFPFQVSVGADILEAVFLEEGEKLEVNGMTVKGPMIVASRSLLKEYTVTVLGADSNTSTLIEGLDGESQIAAQHHHLTLESEDNLMKFEAWVESLGLTIAALDANALAKLRASFDQQVTAGIIKAENTAVADAIVASQQMPTTQTTVAAGAGALSIQAGGVKGTDGATLQGVDLTKLMEQVNSGIVQAQQRVVAINAIIQAHDKVQKVSHLGKEMSVADYHKAVLNDVNITAENVELAMLKASYSLPRDSDGAPAIHIASQIRDLGVSAISCAVNRQMGMVASRIHPHSGQKFGYENQYSQEALEASDHKDLRGISLHQIMDMTIHAAGMSYSGNRKSDAFVDKCREALQKLKASGQLEIKANASGPTTMALTTIFEDVMHKAMLAAYMMMNTTWQEIAGVKSVSDFRTHNLYRMETNGAYRKVGVDGQLEHGTFSEAKFTHSADTYGKIVGLNRVHLINDDMDAFNTLVTALGMEAGVSLEELFYVTLLAALATFYPTNGANNNYVSGASSVLGVDGYELAARTFANQIKDDTSPIGITADRVLIGTAQQVLAGQLFRDSQYDIGGTTGTKSFVSNPWVGAFRPVMSPYMNNVLIKQRVSKANFGAAIPGQSATQYILFGNPSAPQGASVYVSFLNGNRLPVVQQDDAPFDVLGLRWRAFHDFGVDLGDPKLSVYVKGAA